MQINRINIISNTRFGMLDTQLENKMRQAVQNRLPQSDKLATDLDFILENCGGSCLFEKRFGTKRGVISDNLDRLPDIDISEACQANNETDYYLKIIKILANNLRAFKRMHHSDYFI